MKVEAVVISESCAVVPFLRSVLRRHELLAVLIQATLGRSALSRLGLGGSWRASRHVGGLALLASRFRGRGAGSCLVASMLRAQLGLPRRL